MKYKHENEIVGNVNVGDYLYFTLNGQDISAMVDNEVISFNLSSNDAIFTKLGLDKMAYCKEIYGYTPIDGYSFPRFKYDDMTAATKLIKALFKECAASNMMTSVNGQIFSMKQLRENILRINEQIRILTAAKNAIEKNG